MSEDPATTELVVRCACGFEARASEEDLIVIVQEHGLEAHNMTVTIEQVLARLRLGRRRTGGVPVDR